MYSEGFLIGIDLHVRLKLCRFLIIFLNGYIDTLKIDLFAFTVKKKETTTFKYFLLSLIGPKQLKLGILSRLRYKMQKSR